MSKALACGCCASGCMCATHATSRHPPKLCSEHAFPTTVDLEPTRSVLAQALDVALADRDAARREVARLTKELRETAEARDGYLEMLMAERRSRGGR